MGSRDGGAPAPEPPPSVECCMCGDHGLSRELFRCRSCHFRYQHKYCSDLYPKAESYKSCNWCLKEDHKKKKKTTANKDNNNNNSSSSNSNSSPMSSSTTSENNNSNRSSNGSSNSSSTMKLQRGLFLSQQDMPVKKQKSLQRSSSEVIMRVRTDDISSTSTRMKNSNTERGRPGFRGKIRRYKLLEEVSS